MGRREEALGEEWVVLEEGVVVMGGSAQLSPGKAAAAPAACGSKGTEIKQPPYAGLRSDAAPAYAA